MACTEGMRVPPSVHATTNSSRQVSVFPWNLEVCRVLRTNFQILTVLYVQAHREANDMHRVFMLTMVTYSEYSRLNKLSWLE